MSGVNCSWSGWSSRNFSSIAIVSPCRLPLARPRSSRSGRRSASSSSAVRVSNSRRAIGRMPRVVLVRREREPLVLRLDVLERVLLGRLEPERRGVDRPRRHLRSEARPARRLLHRDRLRAGAPGGCPGGPSAARRARCRLSCGCGTGVPVGCRHGVGVGGAGRAARPQRSSRASATSSAARARFVIFIGHPPSAPGPGRRRLALGGRLALLVIRPHRRRPAPRASRRRPA